MNIEQTGCTNCLRRSDSNEIMLKDVLNCQMTTERKNRILLVEDDLDTRFAMSKLFELEGFEVSTASDGQEAYLKAQAEKPDVIVTDLNMPNLSGLDLIRLLKDDGMLAGVPIVAMSAVEKQYLNRARELGAAAVCQKPIEFDQFISLILQIMATARRARARNHQLPEHRRNNRRNNSIC